MADLPEHPDDGILGGAPLEGRVTRRRRTYLWWVVGLALVVLMIVLHVTGVVGAGTN